MTRHDLPPIRNFVRDPIEQEAALVVLEDETLDLMAVLENAGTTFSLNVRAPIRRCRSCTSSAAHLSFWLNALNAPGHYTVC